MSKLYSTYWNCRQILLTLFSGRGLYHALVLLPFAFGCLFAAQPSVGAAEEEEREARQPRKVGKWQVTPIGQCRDRLYYRHFRDQHRLFLAIDRTPAQLWDTQTGKRVAILVGQKRGVDSCAISPDGTRLLTADRLEKWPYFSGINDKNRKVVTWLWLWDLCTGKLLKKIEVDLSAEELRYSTDWEVDWRDKDKILIQLDCRQNPARASARTILGYLHLGTDKVEKWSKPISAGESLLCSPDGKRSLAGCDYGIWRMEDGVIASGGRGTTAHVDLIDMVDLKVIAALDEKNLRADERSIVRRFWSKNSRLIATVGSDHTIGIWEGDKGKPVSTIKGHKDWVMDVTFSPDGKALVTASDDETGRLWVTSSGKQLRVFEGHTAGLNCAVFDAKGQRILTGGEDETARLWDVATGRQIRAWGAHESGVCSVGFEEDVRRIWTQTIEGVRRVWKIEDGALLSEDKSPKTDSFRFGVLFLKQRNDKGYEIWSGPPGVPGEGQSDGGPPKNRPRFTFKGDSHFQARAITADGKLVASMNKNRTVSLWNLERWDKVTGQGRTFLPPQPDALWRLEFTPDGKALAVACEDGTVRLWDLAPKKERLKFEGEARHIRSLVFSPDGSMLAGGSWQRGLYLWKVSTGKLIMSKVDATGPIHAVAFSPDGKTLASAGMVRDPEGKEEDSFYKPGVITLWEVASGKPRLTLIGFRTAVKCLAFTPDGKALIAGDFDKELSFWNFTTGEKKAVVMAGDSVDYLAISPNGKMLVSADGFSDVLELWDIASAKKIGRFRSSAGQGGFPAFTPDGRTLIVSGRRVQFWDVGELLKAVLQGSDDAK